jgi:hypothetical protein
MAEKSMRYSIDLKFEEIKLPPFEDILILGKNSSQGKKGLFKSVDLLSPGEFEMVEIKEGNVEAVYISRKITQKLGIEKVLSILRKRIFGLISEGELAKVDFKMNISFNSIEPDEF